MVNYTVNYVVLSVAQHIMPQDPGAYKLWERRKRAQEACLMVMAHAYLTHQPMLMILNPGSFASYAAGKQATVSTGAAATLTIAIAGRFLGMGGSWACWTCHDWALLHACACMHGAGGLLGACVAITGSS